jgi:hypothetical protein
MRTNPMDASAGSGIKGIPHAGGGRPITRGDIQIGIRVKQIERAQWHIYEANMILQALKKEIAFYHPLRKDDSRRYYNRKVKA